MALFERSEFCDGSLEAFLARLRIMEAPDNSLHNLVKSLPAAAHVPPIRTGRIPMVKAVTEEASTEDMAPQKSVGADVQALHDLQAKQVSMMNATLDAFSNRMASLFAGRAPVVNALPVSSGAGHAAVLAALALGFDLAQDAGLRSIPSKMDATWMASFGCTDLAPAPCTESKDRPILRVVDICHAAGLPLPVTFEPTNDRQMGGEACPFCPALAAARGIGPLEWHVFPKVRPRGAEHRYEHRISKCAGGLAIAHRLVRLDRDAGRGDARKALLTPPPEV